MVWLATTPAAVDKPTFPLFFFNCLQSQHRRDISTLQQRGHFYFALTHTQLE